MGSARTPVTLTPARHSDAATIASLSRALIERGLPWSWSARRVLRHIEDRECVVLVARVGGTLAGFAIMAYGRRRAHLNLLAVRPQFRRRGIARQLIEWLEATARVAGTFVIGVEVRAVNRAARAMYRRLGYREIVCLPGYYFGREDAIRLTRDLSVHPSSAAGRPSSPSRP